MQPETCQPETKKPKLTVFRGLPGSGKSSAAKKLGCLVLEPADMMATVGGEYVWDGSIDRWRIKQFCQSHLTLAAQFGYDVAIAEVLPRRYDVEAIYLPFRNAFEIEVIDMPMLSVDESFKRNVHGVKREDIERFKAVWERWNSEC